MALHVKRQSVQKGFMRLMMESDPKELAKMTPEKRKLTLELIAMRDRRRQLRKRSSTVRSHVDRLTHSAKMKSIALQIDRYEAKGI